MTTTLYEPAGLAAEVAAELSKPANRRVIASVNEARGTVTTVIAPMPPRVGNETEAQARELDGLRAEASALRAIIDRPSTTPTERMVAETRLREIERQLRDESLRRQPWMLPSAGNVQGKPDWSAVSEAGRGLVTMIAVAAGRGEELGDAFDTLPAALNGALWRSSPAWQEWVAAPAATRRAFVQSVLDDLRRAG